jgi:hypothetical protein
VHRTPIPIPISILEVVKKWDWEVIVLKTADHAVDTLE